MNTIGHAGHGDVMNRTNRLRGGRQRAAEVWMLPMALLASSPRAVVLSRRPSIFVSHTHPQSVPLKSRVLGASECVVAGHGWSCSGPAGKAHEAHEALEALEVQIIASVAGRVPLSSPFDCLEVEARVRKHRDTRD